MQKKHTCALSARRVYLLCEVVRDRHELRLLIRTLLLLEHSSLRLGTRSRHECQQPDMYPVYQHVVAIGHRRVEYGQLQL